MNIVRLASVNGLLTSSYKREKVPWLSRLTRSLTDIILITDITLLTEVWTGTTSSADTERCPTELFRGGCNCVVFIAHYDNWLFCIQSCTLQYLLHSAARMAFLTFKFDYTSLLLMTLQRPPAAWTLANRALNSTARFQNGAIAVKWLPSQGLHFQPNLCLGGGLWLLTCELCGNSGSFWRSRWLRPASSPPSLSPPWSQGGCRGCRRLTTESPRWKLPRHQKHPVRLTGESGVSYTVHRATETPRFITAAKCSNY